MVVAQIFGWLSVLLGALIVVAFPSVRQYTPDNMSNAGIILGIFFIVLGIFLIKS